MATFHFRYLTVNELENYWRHTPTQTHVAGVTTSEYTSIQILNIYLMQIIALHNVCNLFIGIGLVIFTLPYNKKIK